MSVVAPHARKTGVRGEHGNENLWLFVPSTDQSAELLASIKYHAGKSETYARTRHGNIYFDRSKPKPRKQTKMNTLTKTEIEIVKANLREYADCLFEQAGWCGSPEDEQNLREDARESIALANKIEAHQ